MSTADQVPAAPEQKADPAAEGPAVVPQPLRCSSCEDPILFKDVTICSCCHQLICSRCRIQAGRGVFHCPACRQQQAAPPPPQIIIPCGVCLGTVPPEEIQTCALCHRIICVDCRVPLENDVFHCNLCHQGGAPQPPPEANAV